MGGWTKFVLENPKYQKDLVKGNLAGLKSVINVYENNKDNAMKKDKSVEKLVKLNKKGELENWVKEQLKK